jgi:hypothetical protein
MSERELGAIERTTEEVIVPNESAEEEPLEASYTPKFDPYFPQVRPRREPRLHSPFEIYKSLDSGT